jgi:RNA polymerase-binding protein DksA
LLFIVGKIRKEKFMPRIEEHRAATAADILTAGRENQRVAPRWQKHFERLTRLRDHLTEQRSTQMENGHTSELSGSNPADRGTDEYDVGAALSLISTEQNAINEIDQALSRIRNGAYGICEATGQPIPSDRLEAVPWTRFARDVEEKLEREQQARKPRHVF